MLDIAARISAFETLGRFISQYQDERPDEDLKKINAYFLEGFRHTITEAGIYNNWFTKDNVEFALQQWSNALTQDNLEAWVGRYPKEAFEPKTQKTIAIIMAGNIPLVGFHDFLTVLLTGNKVLAKPSTDDDKLLPFLAQILVAIDKRFAEIINLASGQLKEFDAVIATGSDNSARYFDHYFGKYPNVIRKNRTSVAVLTGDETPEQLKELGWDVFRYFGLGCRNVSKLFLPQGYDINNIFKAFFDFSHVVDNKKYGNNYDYNRAIFMMEQHKFLENGFVILKENEALHAPAAVVYHETYSDLDSLNDKLSGLENQLQCIVSEDEKVNNAIAMGEAQQPNLWDYADKVDTVSFLQSVQ
ncbi:acyl-CoA reductase [Owenweeksia hongkongensis]|uniref:acyl-CoA reductase n=1 Tax=Owenweeksia hongkongensis TaxID=253245 RepID=UPI003A93A8B9